MEIETSQLKASELGKIVYAYARHKKIEPGVKRLADQLVSTYTLSAAAESRLLANAAEFCSAMDETYRSQICFSKRPHHTTGGSRKRTYT